MASYDKTIKILVVGQIVKLKKNMRRDEVEAYFREKASSERNQKRKIAYENAAKVLELIGAHRGRLESVTHNSDHILTIKCAFDSKSKRDLFSKEISWCYKATAKKKKEISFSHPSRGGSLFLWFYNWLGNNELTNYVK